MHLNESTSKPKLCQSKYVILINYLSGSQIYPVGIWFPALDYVSLMMFSSGSIPFVSAIHAGWLPGNSAKYYQIK